MCDYSLQHLASRPAKVGDRLVTTKFTHSITRGFAAVGEPHVAVCLLPGTEIVVDGYQAKDGTKRANGRDLTFPDGRKLFLGSSGTGAPYELTPDNQKAPPKK